MNAHESLELARRFISLPLAKRSRFWQGMQDEGLDMGQWPIPAGTAPLARAPLSFAQRRMWVLWKMDPSSGAYNLASAVRLRGRLDLNALEATFAVLLQRHPALRTTFAQDAGEVFQTVAQACPLNLQPVDLRGRDSEVQACLLDAAHAPFDLEHGPLLRVHLLALGDEDHVLLLGMHHIVSDGWSLNVLIREFAQLYPALCHGEPAPLAPLPIAYADYALWQRSLLEAGEAERQLGYWRGQLGDRRQPLELPTDRPRPAVQSNRGASVSWRLERALVADLRALAKAENVSLFMLLLAAFKVLLQRHSGQSDLCIGVPVANRNRLECEGLIGFFVNTQVLRSQLDSRESFSRLLARVKATALAAQAHQELPFEQLLDALGLERSLSYNPLFQVMYNHQQRDLRAFDHLAGLQVEPLALESRTAKFDLGLDTLEDSHGLSATFNYATDLFDAARIEQLREHFTRLLGHLAREPHRALGDLPMLGADELAQLADWNALQPTPAREPVHQWLARIADARGGCEAVRCGADSLTYAQLEEQANRLAQRLRHEGVGAEVRVGVALPRSPQMIVALLAVVKAGGAYVPLDASYPRERLAYLIDDSAMALLLTDSSLHDVLPVPARLAVLLLDQLELGTLPATAPVVNVHAQQLAYVIYTSGSTGNPKGVAVAHGPLSMHIQAIGQRYQMTAEDCELHFMSFAFDGAHERWLTALTHGARLLLRDDSLWTPEQTYAALHAHKVSVAAFPPVYLQQLAEHAERDGHPPVMRIYCFGGDAVPEASYQRAQRALRPQFIINGYGPTETVVTPLIWKADAHTATGAPYAPIGSRIGARSAWVLDADLNPVPVGVAGELYLGGEGLARGYLNRAGLTAERFIADPFSPTGGRLYRTGDRVRQRADGTVDYLGRLDHQVKIRGFRVELGEIEARLQAEPEVRDAVVVAREGLSGKRLVAYVVADAPASDLCERLKARLHDSLPDYMVPAQWLLLERLPVTPNGKLDRQHLPDPGVQESLRAYVAPRTEVERQLADIWQAVLKQGQVGLHDNFFELGGDSIIAIQVVSRARAQGLALTPKDLFQHQSLQALARATRRECAVQIDQGEAQGHCPLTPIQHWFFDQQLPSAAHWNQSVLLHSAAPLDPVRLQQALARVLAHHDALRLRFSGAGAAHYGAALPVLWQRTAVDAEQLLAHCEAAQRSLDLGEGPLLRALLVAMADGSQRLLLVAHHLVVDGVSWRIVLEDLQAAYRQSHLPTKTNAVRDWSQALQAYAKTPRLLGEMAFWCAQTADAPWPTDRAGGRPAQATRRRAVTRLDAHTTRQLLQQAPAAYRTQVNDLLLTALARVLCRFSGQASALIQLEGHGREELFAGLDLSRSVGWFTSAYPVRLTPPQPLGDAIKSLKEQLRAVPDKGLGYGVLRYLADPATRAQLAALAPPRVTFNYLGQFDTSFSDDALFTPAVEARGAEQSADAVLGNWLSVNGQVYGGELSLDWTYSCEQYHDSTVQALADDLASELRNLVAHCVNLEVRGLTPSDVPLAGLDQTQLDALPLPLGELDDLYPLAPLQQGLLFHAQYATDSAAYVNQLRVDIDGLQVARFGHAWQGALQAHDILRARFVWEGLAQPLQAIVRHCELPMTVLDWREHADLTSALADLAAADQARGFDLTQAPLLRLTLVRTGADRHHLLFTSHHILLDGWSTSQLFGDVLQRYTGEQPAVGAGFARYVGWLLRQDAVQAEQFWRKQTALLVEPTRLSNALARTPVATDELFGEHQRQVPADETARWQALAKAAKMTLNTLVQAAWLLLLQRCTGQQAVALGVTVAGRPADLPGIEQQLGLFINTLPMIAQPLPALTAQQWLQAVQQQNLALRDFQYTPLGDIQRWAGQPGEALFDTLLVFENYPVAEQLQHAGQHLQFGAVQVQEHTNYPLTLSVLVGQQLQLELAYQHAHFDATRIEWLAEQLEHLMRSLLDNPELPVGELALLNAEQQRAVLNPLPRAPATRVNLCEQIEAQAARRPETPALVFADESISYGQMNARANRLAHQLRALGAGPEVRIGLSLRRSPDMAIALLAVLKSGAAYVPLDPDYPAQRLHYMASDSGIALLLRDNDSLTLDLPVIDLQPSAQWWAEQPEHNPLPCVAENNLAYVIYTSGSTGQPKGVLIDHLALADFCALAVEYGGLSEHDRVLQFATYSFDGFVEQLFASLCAGARVVIRDAELWDSERLYREIIEQGITLADLPAAYWHVFVQDCRLAGPRSYGRLRQVHAGGEAMSVDGVRQWAPAGLGQVRLLNTYGPTEASVVSTVYDCAEGVVDSVPIGRPLAGRRSLVLDADLNAVPAGVAGELCIGGVGLARGYHGRAALTAERFIADPTCSHGARLYRTGDLVRYRADGVLEYLGRIDHQLKIRGYRVELGEIEARILEHEGVRETVVVAREEHGHKTLIGYVVAAAEQADTQTLPHDLQQWLQAELPEYMVPARWVVLEALPLNPNGKIDRKALPLPNVVSTAVIAPRNATEQALVTLWQHLLRVEAVSVSDNFFALGGDSIISLQVVSRARQVGIKLTPRDLFQHPTVEALARVVRIEEAVLPDHAVVTGESVLTPIQHWFFDEPIPQRAHWNQALLLQPRTTLEAHWVEQALAAVIGHHDALRLSFSAGRAWHRPLAASPEGFSHAQVPDSEALQQLCNQVQASLDLEHGPLVRGVLADMADGSQRLLLVIHHLVVDGVSWRVLLEDWQQAYDQLARGQAIRLPGKTSAYQRWAQRLGEYAQRSEVQAQLDYWQASLAGVDTALPGADLTASQSAQWATQAFTRLDADTTRALLQQAPAAYRTQVNELLLSALARVLCRWTGQASTLINLEGHGREDLFDDIDLSRTVGWFTSQYPVRLTPGEHPGASIKAIKEQLRAVPDKGIGYGVLRYLAPLPIREALAALPVARITFNYLGQFDAGFEQALLAPAAEGAGHSQSSGAPLDNWLSLNGQVFGDCLSIAWTFSDQVFAESVVQRLAEEYGQELRALVDHCRDPLTARLTPSDVPLAGLDQPSLDALALSGNALADLYPLAPMQQGMLFHSLYAPEVAAYVDQLRVDIDGLDPERFRAAWQGALDAHDILRAGFVMDQERPLQAIRQHLELPMQVLDWRQQDDLGAALDAFASADLARGFDLTQPPLLRLTLLRTAPARYHLVYTSHHILLDGWSTSQLFGEVMQRYAGQVPAPAGRFADYLAWLQGRDSTAAQGFWQQQVAALEQPTRLAAALARRPSGSGHAEHHRVLDSATARHLSQGSRAANATLNTLVQAAWLLLLQRCTGQTTVAMGITVSGRPADLPGVEQQLGLFINTLPVVGQPSPALTASAWLQAVQQQNLALREYEYTPLGDIQRWAGQAGEALFDTLLVFENYPVAEQLQQAAAHLTFEHLQVQDHTTYPLTLSVLVNDEIHLEFGYLREHFDATGIEWLAAQLEAMMAALLERPDHCLGELGLMTLDHQRAMLNPLAATFSYGRNLCVYIEREAARRPAATALVAGDVSISYGDMNARANRLAHHLRSLGAGPEVRVGVALQRSPDLAITLLAVLKSGAAYVPLDPGYPVQRLAYMAHDSQIALLLQDNRVLDLDVPCVQLPPSAQWFTQYPESNPTVQVVAHNLAYVIYTSGSTGNPKGVLIDHLALADFCELAIEYAGLSEQDRVLQFATYSFDGFVEQLFPSLCAGACVVIRDAELWDSERLYREIIEQGITLADLPAAYWHVFVQDCRLAGPRSYGRLRQVHAGGEAMSVEGVRLWASAGLGHVRLVNTYGPTEATVVSTVYDCAEGVADSVPIGRPLPGRRSLVLDAELNAVPPGVAGELCIGGVGLARGYHCKPGFTAERFIADPTSLEGGRLYRTGDLVRYRADGVLEYLGRIDHQLKIRGYRVELGEIEARILEHADVRESLVLAREAQGSTSLVAYLVPAGGTTVQALRESLLQSLRAALPDYMVPSHWVVLDALPLTPNGKVDRKALPAPERVARTVVAPRTPLEQALLGIWQHLLRSDAIGVTDNFFELGGDSIISLQVVSRARQAGIRLTPKDLFQQPTVEKLARVARVQAVVTADHAVVSGRCELTPVQRWFFEEPIGNRHHWNQALLLQSAAALNAGWLAQALQALVAHHDALRLSFTDSGAQHLAAEHLPPVFSHARAPDAEALERLCNELQGSLHLERGPLLRGLLVDMAEGSQRLLLVIHHLVVDGVSWRVLLEDLQQAYQALARGQAPTLPGKTTAWQAWTRHLQTYAQSPALHSELAWWRAELQGVAAELPSDGTGSGVLSVDSVLDAELTRRLLTQAPAAYRTQVNELLLTALARVVCRWSGQPHALIQLEGHGREDLFDGVDLSRTVGWFTTLYPLKLSPVADLGTSIKTLKEQVRAVPGNGLGYGVLRYLGSTAVREALKQLPQPRITFNYLGQLDAGSDALLRLAPQSAGRSQGEDAPLGNWLNIDGQVHGEQLTLSWVFDRQRFQRATVQRLAVALEDELRAVVEHCASARGFTPADFPLAGLDQPAIDALYARQPLLEDVYPLSPMQSGMLFHALDNPTSAQYVNQLSVPVSGLDPERFRAAWQQAVDRHAILRSAFVWQGEVPLQVVQRHLEAPVQVVDGRGWSAEQLAEREREEREGGFDLACLPLQRVLLVQRGGTDWQLIWTSHHILLDGWSSARLIGEVLAGYEQASALPAAPSYRDYIAWLAQQDEAADERFWRERLGALSAPTLLATVIPSRSGETGHGAVYTHLSEAVTAQLLAFTQARHITFNTLVQGAWLLLLQRYTGQASVAFGSTVAGRPADLPGAEDMLGLFINTLPVIQTPVAHQSVGAWLQQLQDANLALREHEHTPLYRVQRWAGQSGQALFDSIVVFENYPIDEALGQAGPSGLRFGRSESVDVTSFAMDLAVSVGTRLEIEYLYRRDCLDAQACATLRDHFESLLLGLAADHQRALADVPMLGAVEQRQLKEWNAQPPAAVREPVHHWLARVAAERGAHEAVRCASQVLSFAELDAQANRLAHRLRSEGVGAEVRVGVALSRSPQMIVALLAVLKAGGAYVPLDASYPQARLAYLMQDSGIALLLTERALRAVLPVPGHVHALLLDELDLSAQPSGAPQVVVHPQHLAYVIYTSGSTGNPKGVAVAHGPLSMHIQAIGQRYEMTPEDCELHFMSFAFDGAHERWLTALTHGARLLLRDDALWTPEQTYAALHQHQVTVAAFPPVYLQQLAEHAERDGQPPAVRIYCFGGDAVPQASYERAHRALQPQFIINGYGPTETVVTPLIWKACARTPTGAPYAPIGSRVGARSAWVLDEDLNPVPVGIAGELYLGGEGLARGYLNRASLTAERFVADPFSQNGGRLYRTGDRVRQRADGTVDYLGRLDHQVKIRGFRIELGEIEARLQAQPEVRDAVVVARDGVSGKRLVAYLVADDLAGDLCAQLKARLQDGLPDYMVPSQWLVLDRLPVTANGKLDRQNLPEPGAALSAREYVAPRNELEQALADIWQAVLKVEQVGVHDNFFELGGDSILSLQVVGKARALKSRGLTLKLRDLIQKPSIAELTGIAHATAPSPILALNRDVPGVAPLFCVHAGFGTVFDYEPLARRLEGQRPVLAIQSRKLLDPQWQDLSLTAMANDYVELLRARQPHGPYHLLGWSLGSTLVTLMAARLEQQGQAVAFLGLADPFVPAPWVRETPMPDWRTDLAGFIDVLLPQCPPLPAAPPAETEANVVAVLTAALIATGASGEGRYTALGADEMAQVFGVARQLKRLSRDLDRCPALYVAPTCWWVAEREEDRDLLATQLQQPELDGQRLACGHFEVPHAPLFLATLEDALAAAPVALP